MEKVLFLSHQAEFIYGGEICTLSFMRELKKRAIPTAFAAPQGPYFEAAKVLAPAFELSSLQFSRKISQLPNLVPSLWKTHKEIGRLIQQERISLIHATSLKAMVYCFCVAGNIPVIWHHHDILPASFRNHVWVKLLAARAARILVPSQATKDSLLAAGVADEKVFVLFNGFRAGEWKKRGERKRKDTLRMAVLGEISSRKGHDRLGEILDVLEVEPARGVRVELLIIGAGLSDQAFAEKVRGELEPRGVRFLGRREDIRELLQEIDLLLVPSRQDPLPTVIVEAGLSGVPVIGSRVGGIPEMIQPEENGYLADTAEEYARAIREVADPNRWEQLSNGARRLAEQRFDIRKLTDSLLDHYRALQ